MSVNFNHNGNHELKLTFITFSYQYKASFIFVNIDEILLARLLSATQVC